MPIIQDINRKEFIKKMSSITLSVNNRLKNTLNLEYAAIQENSSWIAPKIYTLNEWAYQLLETACFQGLLDPKLLPKKILNSSQQKILFTKIITETETNPLLSYAEIAKQAVAALTLLQTFQLNNLDSTSDYFSSQEVIRFKVWLQKYQQFCSENNTIDATEVLVILVKNINKIKTLLPKDIQIAGFDKIHPLMSSLLQNSRIFQLSYDVKLKSTAKYEFDSISQEIFASIIWAKDLLSKNSNYKICIIVPQLEQFKKLIKNNIKTILYPDQVGLNSETYTPIHNISLGEPLISFKLISTALQLINLFISHETHDYQNTSDILRSSFWSHDSLINRHQFDQIFCREIKLKHSLNDLTHLFGQKDNQLDWMQDFLAAKDIPKPTSNKLVEQLKYFEKILSTLKYADFQSSSINIQLLKSLSDAFTETANLQDIHPETSLTKALSLLQKTITDHTFQFKTTTTTQIQILGMLESSGQEFDAIWVMQSNSNILPPPAKPNSILPINIQTKYDMPRSSNRHELKYAQIILNRLAKSTPILNYSYSLSEKDNKLSASKLIANIKMGTQKIALPEFIASNIKLESLVDDSGAAIETPTKLKKAVLFLKAQAICPLAAYAQFRLGADYQPTPQDDYSPMVRGNIIHKILELIYSKHAGNNKLINSIVEKVIKQHATNKKIGAKKTELEIIRVQKIISDWFENVEAKRTSFSCYKTEANITTELAGFTINLIIDRIDKINDQLLLIDYKTSSTINTKGWLNDRLTEPQLPLYAITIDNVCGIAFAQTLVKNSAIKDLSSQAILANKKTKTNHEQWQAHQKTWQDKLEILAAEIKSGKANLLLNDLDDLKKSPALSFTRIYENV